MKSTQQTMREPSLSLLGAFDFFIFVFSIQKKSCWLPLLHFFQLSLTDVSRGFFYRLKKPLFPASENSRRMPNCGREAAFIRHAGGMRGVPPKSLIASTSHHSNRVQPPNFVIGFDRPQKSCFSVQLKSNFQPIIDDRHLSFYCIPQYLFQAIFNLGSTRDFHFWLR